jgi:hypothetical protein
MAKIWFCRDGNSPSIGEVMAALPFADCAQKLAITPQSFRTDTLVPPRLANVDSGRPAFRGFHHVVVELDEAESAKLGWKSGFYLSPLLPEEARELLGIAPP